jgi:acyltransferase
MERERIYWIDICRALGIIAVIYGHALTWNSHRYILYAFHIPLFFFIAGLVHHYKKSQHFPTVLKKSIKNNLVPYFIFALLTYLAVIAIGGFQNITSGKVIHQLLGILYGSGNLNFLAFNVALWFLPCLFITKIGFFLIEKISDTKRFLAFAMIAFSLIGYTTSVYFRELKLPFGIESALTGIVFFGLGYLMEKEREKVAEFLRKYAFIILPASIIICIVIATLNFNAYGYQIDMRLNKLANYFYFYIGAISGITACITASIILKRNRILEYIGQNSLVLYIWHWPLFILSDKITKTFLTPTSFLKNIYLAPIYTSLATTIILILNKCNWRKLLSTTSRTNTET